jgi:hypothetical protein
VRYFITWCQKRSLLVRSLFKHFCWFFHRYFYLLIFVSYSGKLTFESQAFQFVVNDVNFFFHFVRIQQPFHIDRTKFRFLRLRKYLLKFRFLLLNLDRHPFFLFSTLTEVCIFIFLRCNCRGDIDLVFLWLSTLATVWTNTINLTVLIWFTDHGIWRLFVSFSKISIAWVPEKLVALDVASSSRR